jgi:transposase
LIRKAKQATRRRFSSEDKIRILMEGIRGEVAVAELSRKVDVTLVRSLLGVKVDDPSTKAILATTSRFTEDAREFCRRNTWELELRDYDGIVDWLKLAVHNRRY